MELFAAEVMPKVRAEFAEQDGIPMPAPVPVFESQGVAA
jgi:hypothetical protein